MQRLTVAELDGRSGYIAARVPAGKQPTASPIATEPVAKRARSAPAASAAAAAAEPVAKRARGAPAAAAAAACRRGSRVVSDSDDVEEDGVSSDEETGDAGDDHAVAPDTAGLFAAFVDDRGGGGHGHGGGDGGVLAPLPQAAQRALPTPSGKPTDFKAATADHF